MMQLPNLQANKAASSTVAPKKQQSIRPQSGGLMKATMTKQLMPQKGDEVSPVTMEKTMRPTSMTPPAQSTSAKPNRYTPQTMNVTGDMRVEDRVNGLLSQDNPLMQKAREQANRYSASRGLQSSSIANENALNAMFNTALPIAQQDANTYSTVAQTNNQNAQQVGMQDNAALNQLYLNKDNQQFTAGESAADRSLQERLQGNQFDFESGQSGADRALQKELQESQQNFQSGENSQNRSFEKEMQDLQYKNQLGILSAEETIRMRELEAQQSFQGEQNEADRTFQERMQEQQQQFQSGENQADRTFQSELEGLRYENSLGLLDAEGQQRMQELESQQSFQAEQNSQDRSFQKELETLRNQFAMGQLDAQGQQRMQELEAQQEFQSGENSADRTFQQELEQLRYENSLGTLDAQGEQRMAELEAQNQNQRGLMELEQDFQSGENAANRDFQMEMEKFKTASQLEVNMALQNDMQSFNKELEEIRNANQMGMLDAEGQQRMKELEQQNQNALKQMDKSATIQTNRDNLLQSFQGDNMKMEMANRLTEIEAQTKANMEIQASQNDFAQKMEYSNAVSNAVNQGIASLGEAFMNPEIDPSQYSNIQSQIQNMVQQNISTYSDIYGIEGGSSSGADQNEYTGPYRGNEGSTGNPTAPVQGGGPATGGGARTPGNGAGFNQNQIAGGLMGNGNVMTPSAGSNTQISATPVVGGPVDTIGDPTRRVELR